MNLVGVNWPNVDEDQLRSSADTMRQLSQELTSNTGEAKSDIEQMLRNNSSQALQLFEALWHKLAGSHLPQVAQAMNIVADGLDAAAVVVVGLKAAAIAQLAELAAEIIADQAAAPETFGASEALIPVETEATHGIMQEIIDQAVQQVEQQLMQAVEQQVINALTSAGQELAGQLVGDALGTRNGIDLGAVAQAGGQGSEQGWQGVLNTEPGSPAWQPWPRTPAPQAVEYPPQPGVLA
jgi:hypothetical protein